MERKRSPGGGQQLGSSAAAPYEGRQNIGFILRYWSLEYTAVYRKSPKWGSFKHNILRHNWETRGIPQLTYACTVHCTIQA